MKLTLDIVGLTGVKKDLKSIPEKFRYILEQKMRNCVEIVKGRVYENLFGEVLHIKSGELVGSVRSRVEVSNRTVSGVVYISPKTDKALALEFGGKGYYPIDAKNAPFLEFFWEKELHWVKTKHVNHPPSKEFRYLRLALEESETEIFEELTDVLYSTGIW